MSDLFCQAKTNTTSRCVPSLCSDSNLNCRYYICPKWRRGPATKGRNTEQGCGRPSPSPCLPLVRLVTLGMVISLLRSSIKRGRDLPHRLHIAQNDEGCETLCKLHRYERLLVETHPSDFASFDEKSVLFKEWHGPVNGVWLVVRGKINTEDGPMQMTQNFWTLSLCQSLLAVSSSALVLWDKRALNCSICWFPWCKFLYHVRF